MVKLAYLSALIYSDRIHEQVRIELTGKHTIRQSYICLIDYLDVFNTLSVYIAK